MMDEYWRRLPAYQGVAVSDLVVERVLFGAFATYRNSPLAPQFDRVIQAGDASGIQSPLSFGGLGALSRHAPRLATALSDALEKDCLDRASLAAINAYSPGLSAAWMLQRAMSARPEAPPPSPDFINRLLGANFRAMQGAGDAAMRPFLQDVLQFGPLVRTLAVQVAIDPVRTEKGGPAPTQERRPAPARLGQGWVCRGGGRLPLAHAQPTPPTPNVTGPGPPNPGPRWPPGPARLVPPLFGTGRLHFPARRGRAERAVCAAGPAAPGPLPGGPPAGSLGVWQWARLWAALGNR